MSADGVLKSNDVGGTAGGDVVDDAEAGIAQMEVNDNEPQQGRAHQENLLTKVISFDRKSYYLDVRENPRGKYLKLTESSQKRRSTILLSGNVVGTLVQMLDDAIKENYSKREPQPEIGEKWVTIYSKRVMSVPKKIYFDLMQNKQGRSLNVAEVVQNRPKTAVIISEHGWFQFKRALDEIIEQFPVFKAPEKSESALITSKSFQFQNKRFYFDLNENEMGRFLKISELRKSHKETVYIPQICFEGINAFMANLEKGDYEAEIAGLESLPINPKQEEGGEESDSKYTILSRKSMVLAAEDEASSKRFHIDFRENKFGKFLRILEFRPGKGSTIFIPFENFAEVKDVLNEFNSTP